MRAAAFWRGGGETCACGKTYHRCPRYRPDSRRYHCRSPHAAWYAVATAADSWMMMRGHSHCHCPHPTMIQNPAVSGARCCYYCCCYGCGCLRGSDAGIFHRRRYCWMIRPVAHAAVAVPVGACVRPLASARVPSPVATAAGAWWPPVAFALCARGKGKE